MRRSYQSLLWTLFAVTVFVLGTQRESLHSANYLLIPMDETQYDHLRAYGLTYETLLLGHICRWLLNYRGGSFLLPSESVILERTIRKKITHRLIDESQYQQIKQVIVENNMSEVVLEKAPKIAVYSPKLGNKVARDAVSHALRSAEIGFKKIYDVDILEGKLSSYDWLHLHHEEFVTGDRVTRSIDTKTVQVYGYSDIPAMKHAVAKKIQKAVEAGLFLFAMCCATDTLDSAIAHSYTAPGESLDFRHSLAFHREQVNINDRSDFTIFNFSAKIDPISTLLCQNHRTTVPGFGGKTIAFRSETIKDGTTVLAVTIKNNVKYLTGNHGKGIFTYYGGHHPRVPASGVKNSAGYRLILNNILVPAAKVPRKKT